MSKPQQDHFLDKLRRTVQPAAARDEPVIWFREVRILDELSRRDGVERRRIVLHRGLNILWAAPEDPDTEQGLYRDGLAGHASGKTLFCRLLRHFLGEHPFGTKAQREGIADNFLRLWAVALIRVNRVSWVVGRPLAADGADFAVQSHSIDNVLAGTPPVGGYEDFMTEVRSVGAPVEPLHPGEGWRHLMPWLTRDQEARFGSLASWREATSEGDNPQTKAIERHLLMRAVLGVLDLREPALRNAIEQTQTALDGSVIRLARLESEANVQLELAYARAREVLSDSAPPDPSALEARLQSMIEVLREGLAELEKRPEHPTVTGARQKLNEAHDQLRVVEDEVARLPAEIVEKNKRRVGDLLIIRNLKTGNVQDPTRETKGWCPHTIQTAQANKCVGKAEVSTESATNIGDLERAAEAAQREIDTFSARLETLKKQLPNLRDQQKKAELTYQAASREATRDATTLARRAERAEAVVSLFSQTTKSKTAVEAQTKANQRAVAEIEQMKKDAANLRDDADTRLQTFSSDFADIMQAVMGATVEAKISITGDGLVPHVTRKGELSGAALDTIKTLAFDLAAIVSSIEGRGGHPRFLVHDGPREGDMARVIYERFFIYAAELETAFATADNASFQYLITTTTPPPKSMRQGSRWLLEPVLDSRDKNRRLLKEDF